MRVIEDSRVVYVNGKFFASCVCGQYAGFSTKNSALRMLLRGNCLKCKRDYRSVKYTALRIYQNKDKKWCSICSGCNKEQAYTRIDHAKQSEISDWQCRSCRAASRAFSANASVGDKQRVYNKFKNNAARRGLSWDITLEELFLKYTGKCALTGWDISLNYKQTTASVDRLDNSKGYTVENIQWVHVMVNMTRNKYPLSDFVRMCEAISNNACLR